MTTLNKLREVLAALNLIDDLPLDQDLARLIAAASDSPGLVEVIRLAHTAPASFDALWDEAPDEVLEELQALKIPWTKIHRLVPQLAAAIAVLET